MRYFFRCALPSLLTFLAPPMRLQAPETPRRVCIDLRPAYVKALAHAIARREACPGNPGCIRYIGQAGAHRSAHGYAIWDSEADGFAALVHHIEKRMQWSIREILERFNPANDRYVDLVLSGTDLDAELVIAEQTNCP